jgi:hypothetical protein
MPAHDPALEAHKAWLGYVQQDGLVVSPAALVDTQVILDSNLAHVQLKFIDYVEEREDEEEEETELVISDLSKLLLGFLEWPEECVYGLGDERPIPDELTVPLLEFGDTLRPTFAFRDPSPPEDGSPWMLLVKELEPGTDLDARRRDDPDGWGVSWQQRFERLLRETGVPIGLLTNGKVLRLVFAPRGENTGTLPFPVGPMSEIAGRPIVGAFLLLLRKYQLLAAPSEARLPALLKKSRDYQANVSETLAQQVLDSLYELLRGFQAANEHAHGELLEKVLREDSDSIYAGLLNVLMRLVFLLFAEDRGLLPTSELYVRNYSAHELYERLRDDAERNPDTMDHRYGAWARLLALFRCVHGGCKNPRMTMPARRGYLFDPDSFPFLEGQTLDEPSLPLVSDGVIYRVLRNLLLLDGERLSYRTLDVEQIGSVYETMMGFRLLVAEGRSIALKPTKKGGAPPVVNLEALLEEEPKDRAKWLKEHTDRKFTGNVAKAVKEAETTDDFLAAFERYVAKNATPQAVPEGSLVLQPSDERRKSGSHYTPRSLTEPIVRKALEPVFDQLGENPTPEQILELKVCDPAVGSGAFLVEACRQLGDALVDAWRRHGETPVIPPDEDEVLHARRIVAQRCLYGVDRNPMAADLAKLSLWLATLAKDHPFTFLAHAIRSGDSLVGLSQKQIANFHWEEKAGQQRHLGQDKLERRIENALASRREILEAGDLVSPELKQQKLALADEALNSICFAGDLVIAAFFGGSKVGERKSKRDDYLDRYLETESDVAGRLELRKFVKDLRSGDHPITPFHWEIEFPEVFARENGGFDAFVGNPPFLGGTRISTAFGMTYFQWLVEQYTGCRHHCDMVAYFFRRAFMYSRFGGAFGFIATNTIAQGDTREGGLLHILKNGGSVYSATQRFRWPGLAAVVVSVVHVQKSAASYLSPNLDGKPVKRISAYLFAGEKDESPDRLQGNPYFSNGCNIYGLGFLFSDTDAASTPIAEMHRLIEANPKLCERIRPYLIGREINSDPQHHPGRFAIYLSDVQTEKELEAWPELRDIVATKVKPDRMKLGSNPNNVPLRKRWWAYQAHRPELYAALTKRDRSLCVARVGQALGFVLIPTNIIHSEMVVVFDIDDYASFAILQSRVHDRWARFFSSSMKDDLRYAASDCFQTFPFPLKYPDATTLSEIGERFYQYRSSLMLKNEEGITTTFNRFHDPHEQSEDILELRRLHGLMDGAVLRAYGWDDISTNCEFIPDFTEQDDDGNEIPKNIRYRWPDAVRDDVLARLLALNAERAEQEKLAGLTSAPTTKRRAKKSSDDTVKGQGELFGPDES